MFTTRTLEEPGIFSPSVAYMYPGCPFFSSDQDWEQKENAKMVAGIGKRKSELMNGGSHSDTKNIKLAFTHRRGRHSRIPAEVDGRAK